MPQPDHPRHPTRRIRKLASRGSVGASDWRWGCHSIPPVSRATTQGFSGKVRVEQTLSLTRREKSQNLSGETRAAYTSYTYQSYREMNQGWLLQGPLHG